MFLEKINSIAASVMQMGGGLGSIFGGGGDADSARQDAIMESLGKISAQISELRTLVLELNAQEMQALELQSTYLEFLLTQTSEDRMRAGYGDCKEMGDVLHVRGIETPQQFLAFMGSRRGLDNNIKLKACTDWLLTNSRNAVDADQAAATPNTWYTVVRQSIDDAQLVGRGAPEQGRIALGRQLRATAEVWDAMRTLVDGAGTGRAHSLWPYFMQPARSWKRIDETLDLTTQPGGGAQDLGTRLAFHGRDGVQGFRVRDALVTPIAQPRVLVALHMASTLGNVAEALDDTTPHGVTTDYGKVGDTELRVMDSKRNLANDWLRNFAALAMTGTASAVLSRGDYIVPFTSELLHYDAVIPRLLCAAKAPPPQDVALSKGLCLRFGAERLAELIVAAKTVVREMPEIRANVAAYRVRQALGVENELPDGSRYAPQYDMALGATWAAPLERLLPKEQLRRLPPSLDKTYAAPSESESRWFMRLSGYCHELTEIVLNGRAVCKFPGCEGADFKQDENRRMVLTTPALTEPLLPADRPAWNARKADLCVLAPLPTALQVSEGAPVSGPLNENMMSAGLVFVEQAGYYQVLQGLKGEEKLRMITFSRPKTVGLWKRN